jgi:hypothetical protein
MGSELLRVGAFVAACCATGCASRVAVTGTADKALVSFKGGHGQKVPVTTISVFELRDGLRGRVVCELGTRTMSSVSDLNSWIYGTSLPGYEMKCEPLARERKYGIQVEPIDHNAFSTHFIVRADGSVIDVGRE